MSLIQYILLSLVKILDNMIMTWKSLTQIKGQKLLSSILVTISQIMFYVVIKQVTQGNSMTAILVVSIMSGVGNYIGFAINDKTKKDSKYNNFITSSDKDALELLCNYLRDNNIKYFVNDGYNRQWEHTYNLTVFSYTKAQSKLLDKYLETSNFSYLREIIK